VAARRHSERAGVSLTKIRVYLGSQSRLFVEASEVARPFFSAKGFLLIGRNDFEIYGVSIHNYITEKHL
jgi:hypothetical protein